MGIVYACSRPRLRKLLDVLFAFPVEVASQPSDTPRSLGAYLERTDAFCTVPEGPLTGKVCALRKVTAQLISCNFNQPRNFLLAEHLRQAHLLRIWSLGNAPAALQYLYVEETQSRHHTRVVPSQGNHAAFKFPSLHNQNLYTSPRAITVGICISGTGDQQLFLDLATIPEYSRACSPDPRHALSLRSLVATLDQN